MLESRDKKLLFVITEDWFFFSHFLPMARAGSALGLQVSVLTRVREHRRAIEAAGIRIIPFDEERAAWGPWATIRAIRKLAAVFRAERPDIVHFIALKPVVLGGLAAWISPVGKRIYAVTGLGLVGADRGVANKIARLALRALFALILDTPKARFLFENEDDPAVLGFDPGDASKVTIVGGAGVSLGEFDATPLPPAPPVRVAVVARMLWQKGIDLAVEATQHARAKGAAVELSLYGAPDPGNPRAIPAEMLRQWSALDGVKWRGSTRDIREVWATHHVCCLPSRGGEGLPRSILEAAACARPIVTTDVPGCRSFVRDGIDGRVVRPNDPQHLAEALITLSRDLEALSSMGLSARERVSQHYTDDAVTQTLIDLYGALLRRPPRPGSRSCAAAGAGTPT